MSFMTSHDWDNIFEFLNAFKDEMIEFMYRQSVRGLWCRSRMILSLRYVVN